MRIFLKVSRRQARPAPCIDTRYVARWGGRVFSFGQQAGMYWPCVLPYLRYSRGKRLRVHCKKLLCVGAASLKKNAAVPPPRCRHAGLPLDRAHAKGAAFRERCATLFLRKLVENAEKTRSAVACSQPLPGSWPLPGNFMGSMACTPCCP